MVRRQYIKCDTCDTMYTLRIGIGHEPKQCHTFCCTKCAEEISFHLELNPKELSIKFFCDNNCSNTTEEGLIYNIHPEFSIPVDMLHQDMAFPWLQDMLQMHKKIKDNNINDEHIARISKALASSNELTMNWDILNKAWSLFLNNKMPFYKSRIIKYKSITLDKSEKLDEVIFDFIGHFSNTLDNNFHQIMTYISEHIQKKHDEFARMYSYYYETTKFRKRLFDYRNALMQYFDSYETFSQTLIDIKFDLNANRKAENTISYQNFNKIKMIYGNIYEVLSNSFELISLISNILKGRHYNEFEKMDLDKYLKIDKAKRADNFMDIEQLSQSVIEFDSSIRNASHHGDIRYDIETRNIIYSSGRPPKEKTITPYQYNMKCNKIVMNLMLIMRVDLLCSRFAAVDLF